MVNINFGRNFGEQNERQTGTTGSVSIVAFNYFFKYVMGCIKRRGTGEQRITYICRKETVQETRT
jgi:hypothetical protein